MRTAVPGIGGHSRLLQADRPMPPLPKLSPSGDPSIRSRLPAARRTSPRRWASEQWRGRPAHFVRGGSVQTVGASDSEPLRGLIPPAMGGRRVEIRIEVVLAQGSAEGYNRSRVGSEAVGRSPRCSRPSGPRVRSGGISPRLRVSEPPLSGIEGPGQGDEMAAVVVEVPDGAFSAPRCFSGGIRARDADRRGDPVVSSAAHLAGEGGGDCRPQPQGVPDGPLPRQGRGQPGRHRGDNEGRGA